MPVYDDSVSEGGGFLDPMHFVWGRPLREVTRGLHRERADFDFLQVGGDLFELLNQTHHGQQLGPPASIAPEQVPGQLDKLDHRTDIYGLCTELYEVLMGPLPRIDDDVRTMLERFVKRRSRPVGDLPEIPFDLEQTCLRGLSTDPG